MFKTMSQRIKELETTNRFYREPVYTDEDYRLSIKNFSMDKLLDAYARLIDRLNRREADIEPKKVMKERFSVSNRISYIAQRIFRKRNWIFSVFSTRISQGWRSSTRFWHFWSLSNVRS